MVLLVAVLDKKALTFGAVYTSKNEATAIRDFSIACQNPESNLNRFPEDYQLCKLGTFDEEQGKIMPCKVPEVLTSAQAFIQPKNENIEVK